MNAKPMTPKQTARRMASLIKKADRAECTYSRARGRRADSGKRIESSAESKARYRATAATREMDAFARTNGINIPAFATENNIEIVALSGYRRG